MPDAVRLVRQALQDARSPESVNVPRRRVALDHGVLNVMTASLPAARAGGLKAYSSVAGRTRFLVCLWDRDDGDLLALIEADALGRLRTGAASGVATDLLANTGACVMALIGSGSQAQTQLEAVACVRGLSDVRVYSRRPERREAFAAEMRARTGLEVRPAASAREAVQGAGIVTTITNAAGPVLHGEWLSTGTHINAAGSNVISRREVDTETLRRSDVITVDSLEQARLEAGDLAVPVEEGALTWDNIREIGDVLTGAEAGRRSASDITLFKSLGIAIEDVVAARHVYNRARAEGRGEHTSFGNV